MTASQPSPRMIYLDILAAAMLLTRIPVEWPQDETPQTARSYWAFPLIGVGVAAPPALLAGVMLHFGLPPLAAAMLTLAGIALITGGLHQDGLADIADGLGGRDAADRLRIMRDSSIGSYGTLALISLTFVSMACLAAIAAPGLQAMVHAMISAAALSRAMMAVQRHLNGTPDNKGLANMTGQPSGMIAVIAVLVGLVIAVSFSSVNAALLMLLSVLAVTYGLGRGLNRMIGGVNGDGLGATQQITEMVMLMILVMAAT